MKAITIVAFALATLTPCAWPAENASYPAKPIRIIVPSSPGGGLDFVALTCNCPVFANNWRAL